MERARPQRPRRIAISLAGFALGGILLSGCGGGPGTEADFVDILQRDDSFSEAQATCIASAVFDKYGEDNKALDVLSGGSWEDVVGENGVPGFEAFYRDTVDGCVTAGPSVGG